MALRLRGSTSGYAEIDAPAVAGDVTLTLPSTTGTINVKDASGNTEVGTGVTFGNPGANIFTVNNTGGERLRIAADGTVSIPGALNVSGVLTYEDVTSVDAIGLSTFRDGLNTKDVGITTISTSVSDTAVDVFVYDTSKDSDGGEWRKRTSHTSWYNEASGSKRSSRKEFPAVAVIVAEASQLTIYDGDDPDLPMWMVFDLLGAVGGNSNMIPRGGSGTESDITSIACLNGKLAVGLKDVSGTVGEGLVVIDFISELARVHRTTASGYTGAIYRELISGRNSNSLYSGDYNSLAIVAETCNDVAMTVLPNAPIDDATGLPVPTIAVATDGGISVIKDDGSVVDITPETQYPSTKKFNSVDFTKDHNIILTDGQTATGFSNIIYLALYKDVPSSDLTDQYSDIPDSISYVWNGDIETEGEVDVGAWKPSSTQDEWEILKTASDYFAVANVDTSTTPGITRIGTYPNHLLTNRTTTDYNTGWTFGFNEATFLSDTDTTNVTGGGDGLITGNDSTFGDIITNLNWSERSGSSGGWNVSGGVLKTGTVSSGEYLDITTSGYTSGQTYVISYTLANVTGSNPIRWRFNDGQMGDLPTSNGSHSYYVTLTETGTLFSLLNDSSLTADIDNFKLQLVQEEDRSVNNKGLTAYGTVTKSAVATGADLVAYSGFSASNYLEQPYNTDLNFGTGDFSVMNWIYVTAGSDYQVVFDRWSNPGGNARIYWGLDASERMYLYFREDSSSNVTYIEGSTSLSAGAWHHIVGIRQGNSVKVYLNGKLDNNINEPNVWNVTPASTSPTLRIGNDNVASPSDPMLGNIALLRISATVPSPEQIKKIYEDEKVLFQENAQATLYGSSDAVTALAYDEVTDQLHVGTSSGRSDFQGLRRINNTTQEVQTAISAHDTFIIEQ